MPLITIGYTANLAGAIDIEKTLSALREAAASTGLFPLGAIRVLATEHAHYRVGDGDPGNAMIQVHARIVPGRDAATKSAIVDRLFEAVENSLGSLFDERRVGLHLELSEVDAALTRRRNTMMS